MIKGAPSFSGRSLSRAVVGTRSMEPPWKGHKTTPSRSSAKYSGDQPFPEGRRKSRRPRLGWLP